MIHYQKPIILMRPGAANERLAERLGKRGMNIWKWPAFTILPPQAPERVQERLLNLDNFDMVLLASPAAVAASAVYVKQWPQHITLATIGSGTARVIRAAWGEHTPVLYPEGETFESGSERLFELLKSRGFPSRVLIVRGQVGREWLREQLLAHGTDVEVLTAYQRAPLELSSAELEKLQFSISGPAPIVYLTSTDSVGVLMHAVKTVPGALEWIQKGFVLTIHPRPKAQLEEVGFRNVALVSAKDERVQQAIEKLLEIV